MDQYSPPLRPSPRAVLFDRDDTLIDDVPYNGDPGRVVARPGARLALDILRGLGILTAVVTNQSGVGRGLITLAQVHAVNRAVERQLGPLGPWLICPHAPQDGCRCRKPAPGLVHDAARALGVVESDCVVVGDKVSDVQAALQAGAQAILLAAQPPPHLSSQVVVVGSLLAAVELMTGPSQPR